MEAKVYITRRLQEEALDLIRSECTMKVNPEDRALGREELMDAVSWIDGLLCTVLDRIDEEVLKRAPSLKVIANYAVGYDNIDIFAATRYGVPICNTPDVLTEATADLAFGLILSTMRRIAEGDRLIRRGKFPKWGPSAFLGTEVHGKVLGIIGLGRIGMAVARRAMAFDMRIIYWDIADKEIPSGLRAYKISKEELLHQADCVSLHIPLTAETRHLIGPEELRMMKKTAFLINTSRGPIVDEVSLVTALQEAWIAGAGLDVFEREPELSPGLAELENVVIVPHIGSATHETRTDMALLAAKNLIAGVRGEVPPNCVNPEVFDK